MHKAKRAIIMAAGKGQRMQPLTLKTPKPLVPVLGKPMIHSLIEALHQNGIFEIYVVVGYRKEQFLSLPQLYPGLQLIENPWFDSCNNISSLYAARAHLEDVIILDGDQLINNAAALSPYFERSGYNAVWTEEETGEWLMTTDSRGIVTHCSRSGGRRGWQLFSVSRWSREDGARLREHLQIEFWEKNNRQIYWDDIAMFCYPDQYCLGIREMRPGDILEIDSLDELAAIDPAYKDYTGGAFQ